MGDGNSASGLGFEVRPVVASNSTNKCPFEEKMNGTFMRRADP
jgi:hypothetical protein